VNDQALLECERLAFLLAEVRCVVETEGLADREGGGEGAMVVERSFSKLYADKDRP